MVKIGIVGATGYTGVELLRLLVLHPEVEIEVVTSRSEAGKAVTSLFPNLRGHLDIPFSLPIVESLSKCDLVFFATPNGTAMKMVPELLAAGCKVIDLAADFRLKDSAQWSHWYGMEHACADLLGEAVYGLPEMNRELIKTARLVANPGCYPTAVQLGFLPLIENGLVDLDRLIADVKSGVSGAGRKASIPHLLTESSESMSAYSIDGHRHLPEIVQGLNQVAASPVALTFMPHLTPMIRGIHATLYGTLSDLAKSADIDLQLMFEEFYKDEPFVDVLEAGTSPQTRNVKGTNNCQISVCRPQQSDVVAVLVVEDNLVKGAAGQAVQNMNIMFDLGETAGLKIIAAVP